MSANQAASRSPRWHACSACRRRATMPGATAALGACQADAALLKRIRTVHASSRQTYGAPRVHAELREQGERHSRKRIARLMREAGLVGRQPSARRSRHDPARQGRPARARPGRPRLQRPSAPNQLWVADITYVPTAAGFLYLAVVLDAWSRRIVGWAMANHLRTELVLDALEMAVGQRRPKDVIHHSRPGQPIYLAGLRQALQRGRRAALDGIGRRRLRQRHGRELLRHPRMRAARPPPVQHPRPRRGWPASASSRAWYNPRRRHSAPGLPLARSTYEADMQATMTEHCRQAHKPSTKPGQSQDTQLKLIKRQMYGRACFDLLRHRVLAAA